LAMMVRMWLAPVALTVSGRAAREQTWIMAVLCGSLDYRQPRRARIVFRTRK
jgi:hypothetical protein